MEITEIENIKALEKIHPTKSWIFEKLKKNGGVWVAQLVKCLTSAQVMVSQFVSSSLTSDFVLSVQSLDPASDSASPSLSASPLLILCLSISKNE